MIDDDTKLSQLVTDYLLKFQFQLRTESNPVRGLELLMHEDFELVILDVMMPEMDGFEVCKKIRVFSQIPIIMLTARGELTDKIVGLEIGADDYLAKPFEPRELVARIQSILRRTNSINHTLIYNDGNLMVNFETEEVSLKNEILNFTSMEYQCLKLLIQQSSKKWSRDDLMNALQGIDSDVFSRSIDILISRIRAKLGEDAKNPKYIKTLRGAGYYFNARGIK